MILNKCKRSRMNVNVQKVSRRCAEDVQKLARGLIVIIMHRSASTNIIYNISSTALLHQKITQTISTINPPSRETFLKFVSRAEKQGLRLERKKICM